MPIQIAYFRKNSQIEQYQSITKDFFQDHINELIIYKKIINKINRDKTSYKLNMESIHEKDQSFPVFPNYYPPASIVSHINGKTPSIDFTLLNTPKNGKPTNNEKAEQIRENHINTIVQNDEGNTLKDNILNDLHKVIDDMINRKMETSFEKIQSICNDELQVLRKELESKNKIINNLLEIIENISNKAVQPNPLPISQLHLEDGSNDMNESDRKEIKAPEINNTSNNQKDSPKEMNNLNPGKTNSTEKQLNKVKTKNLKNIIVLKITFKVMLLKRKIKTEIEQWPKNTILRVCGSIITGILEEGLCGGGRNC